jgi:integrase
MSKIDGVVVVPEPTRERLSERQLVDYKTHRESLIRWLLTQGKDLSSGTGYAQGTVKPRAFRMDQFYRWVWDQSGYTTHVTHDHADQYLQHLALEDASTAHKTNSKKALQMLYSYRHHELGQEPWEPAVTFDRGGSTQPRDYLTKAERTAIRDAALSYGSTPHYNSLDPDERHEWKVYLAQRFEKPLHEIGKADFDRANGFKIPSLVWVSLDTGLRPAEVERATVEWVDVANRVLRIPPGESAKSQEPWIVSIRDQTAEMLRRWLDERDLYDSYDDTDRVWLTREGNPYTSQSLKYVLERLCDIADIDTTHRSMSWYAIRHSVGTYMTREEGLAAAQSQLRHKSTHTTMKYDQTPVEDRRDALDRMG